MSRRVGVVFDRTLVVQAEIHAAAVRGLREIAETVLTEANHTVPLLEGTLMRSGFTDVDDKALQAEVAYDTPYAVIQHEDTEFHHPNGRRARWLFLTVQEGMARYREHMAGVLRAAAK